jgi:uncharacterized protein YkwD
MRKKNRLEPKISLLAAIAATTVLVACGGGGGSGGTGTTSGSAGASTATTQSASSADVATPAYAQGGIELAMFQTVNAARQQCGFPSVLENTTLDRAAANHASYMIDNSGIATDTEVAGNPGFTGIAYEDRAQAVGYPAGVGVAGESAGFYTNATLTGAAYGQQLALGWISGVYHSAIITSPYQQIGFGTAQTTYQGYPQVLASNDWSGSIPLTGNLPLTYPCQGTTGVPYAYGGEIPQPPGTTNGTNWGPAIPVAGNVGDTVTLSSATLTDTSGNVTTLQILNPAGDPNKLIPAYEAVAYATAKLDPSMNYTASITGTYNGKAFSRTFTFTTDNSAA